MIEAKPAESEGESGPEEELSNLRPIASIKIPPKSQSARIR
jgi:hypothetical protein